MDRSAIEILSRIDKSITTMIEASKPQNKDSKESVAKLSKGNVVQPTAQPSTASLNVSVRSVGEIVALVNNLGPAVKMMAKLDGSTTKSFERVVDSIMKNVIKLSDFAKSNEKGIKGARSVIEIMEILAKGIKKMIPLTITAPLAALGLIATLPVIITFGWVLKQIRKLELKKSDYKNVETLTSSVNLIIKMVLKMTLMVGVCLALGALIMAGNTSKILLGGLAVLGLTMLALTAVIFITGKISNWLKDAKILEGVNQIVKLTLGMTLVVAICLALGALIAMGDGTKILLYGLAVLGLTMLALLAVVAIIGWMSGLMKDAGILRGVREIILLTLGMTLIVGLCLLIGALIMSDGGGKMLLYGLAVLGLTMLALLVIILIIGLSTMIMDGMGILRGVKQIIILTLAAMLIVVASKFLGDFVLDNVGSILTGLASTVVVLMALIGVGWVAQQALKDAMRGIAALGVMELVALGAMAVLYAAVKVADETEGRAEDIALVILGCIGVIVAFGALAYAASYIALALGAGSLALAAVVLFAMDTIALMHEIINFCKVKDELGVGWDVIAKNVVGMELVLASFGILATAFGVLIVPLLLSMPAVKKVTNFARECIDVTKGVLELRTAIEEAGGAEVLKKTVSEDIAGIIKSFKPANFKVDMSVREMEKIMDQYEVLKELMTNFASVATSLGEIAKVAAMVDDQGRISPVLAINPRTGDIKLGEPVDLVNIATTIGESIRAFVNTCNYNFEDIQNMYEASAIFAILGTIVDPVTSFVTALTGFTSDGENMLAPIRLDEKGEVKKGPSVNVVDVANVIGACIKKFIQTLYNEDFAKSLYTIVYGDATAWDNIWHGGRGKKSRAIDEALNVFAPLMEPVSHFADMLTSVVSPDGNTLYKLTTDKDGNVKQSSIAINPANVAQAIASAMTAFVSTLYKEENVKYWSSMISFESPLKKMATDVSGFVDILKTLSEEEFAGDSLGKNVDAAVKLISSLSGSIDSFSSEKATSAIDFLNNFSTSLSSYSGIDVECMEKAQKSISSLFTSVNNTVSEAIKPISDFEKELKNVGTSLKNVDDILQKGRANRKKNLDEFRDSIEELLKKISGADDSVAKLYELIRTLQNMDSGTISRKVSALSFSGIMNKPSSTGYPSAGLAIKGQNSDEFESKKPQFVGTSPETITKAIRDAFNDKDIFIKYDPNGNFMITFSMV